MKEKERGSREEAAFEFFSSSFFSFSFVFFNKNQGQQTKLETFFFFTEPKG